MVLYCQQFQASNSGGRKYCKSSFYTLANLLYHCLSQVALNSALCNKIKVSLFGNEQKTSMI